MFSDREVEREELVPQDHKSAQSAIDALNPGDTILVAPGKYREGIQLTSGIFVCSGEVVGFVARHGNEVGTIFVHPIHQRSGVGRQLKGPFSPSLLFKWTPEEHVRRRADYCNVQQNNAPEDDQERQLPCLVAEVSLSQKRTRPAAQE